MTTFTKKRERCSTTRSKQGSELICGHNLLKCTHKTYTQYFFFLAYHVWGYVYFTPKKKNILDKESEVHWLDHSCFSALKHFLDSRFPHDFDWDIGFVRFIKLKLGQGCNEDQFDQTWLFSTPLSISHIRLFAFAHVRWINRLKIWQDLFDKSQCCVFLYISQCPSGWWW